MLDGLIFLELDKGKHHRIDAARKEYKLKQMEN